MARGPWVFWCSAAKATCDEHHRDSSYQEIVRALVARREAHQPQVYCRRRLRVLSELEWAA